jgi:hypothetical protein
MESGAGRHVQDALGAALLEQAHEEITFGFVATVPIDQFVPLVDELFDVFFLVMVRVTNLDRIAAEILRGFVRRDSGIIDDCLRWFAASGDGATRIRHAQTTSASVAPVIVNRLVHEICRAWLTARSGLSAIGNNLPTDAYGCLATG